MAIRQMSFGNPRASRLAVNAKVAQYRLLPLAERAFDLAAG